jgi:Uma2 family endonuclease
MAAIPVLVPVEEYLNTTYRPDRDYIDGEVKERSVGEKPHSRLQAFFLGYFFARRAELGLEALPEQRVQVSTTRFRIPDITILSRNSPDKLIVRVPPVLCIEILSREDTMNEMLGRVEDYLRMGVPAVWIVNPWRREARSATPDGTIKLESESLRMEGFDVAIPVAEIFAELDPE